MEDLDYLNNFSLDMVSTDMNFEQAYNMYNNLQQEHALSSVDSLHKAQSSLASPSLFEHGGNDANFSYHRSKILNMPMSLEMNHGVSSANNNGNSFSQSGTAGFNGQKSHSLSMASTSRRPEDEEEDDDDEEEDDDDEEDNQEEDFDKFFSNTESNALEKFLDNLANPNHSTNPLDLYHHDFNFKPKKDLGLKNDITNVFSHPPPPSIDQIYGNNRDSNLNTQLPTPESRQSSIDEDNLQHDDLDMHSPKRSMVNAQGLHHNYHHSTDLLPSSSISSIDDDFESAPKRRRKSASKPLLSLEQKRLNHSHSEQKRRQLCKLAYERCLRLITNFETYSKQPPINKKSKRKLFTKEGLPNLSKHCALVKISGEISKVKTKNEQLIQLLNGNCLT